MVFPNLTNQDELEMELNLEQIQVYPLSFSHHLMLRILIDYKYLMEEFH